MPVTFEVITCWDRLARHRDEWSQLLERSETNEPTLSPLWIETWWQVFGDRNRQVAAILVYDDSRPEHLIGLAPLLKRRYAYRGLVPLRRLEFLASGESEQDEIYSEYLNVIAERHQEPQVAKAVVRALVSGALGQWDELVLNLMSGRAAMTSALIHALTQAGLLDRVTPLSSSPFIPLPETWKAYLGQQSSSRRYFLKRTMRDLEKWAQAPLSVHTAESPAELAEGRRILVELHGERWRDEGKHGVFSSQKFLRFHRTVMTELLKSGNLELMWLRAGSRPLAIVYNIIWNNRVYFYQSGRTIDVPKKVRPGIAIHVHAIQRALDQSRSVYDFLSGAARYKQQFALDENPMVRVRAVHPRSPANVARNVVARLEGAARTARRHWRDGLHRLEGRQRPVEQRDSEAIPPM